MFANATSFKNYSCQESVQRIFKDESKALLKIVIPRDISYESVAVIVNSGGSVNGLMMSN